MKACLQDLLEFSIPLERPIRLAGESLCDRAGLFVRLTDGAGRHGVGEIAPLPGFHNESLSQCRDALARHRDELSSIEIDWCPESGEPLNLGQALSALEPFETIPSLHFGLSMACINLLAACSGVHPARLMEGGADETVPVNGLVTGEPGDWAATIGEQVRRGCSVIKIKVGRDIEAEASALALLQKEYGNRLRLVLDGNRSLTPDQAGRLLAGLNRDHVLYGEELLQNPAELRDLQERTGIAMALDETLFEDDESAGLVEEWDSVVVLKADRLHASVVRAFALGTTARHRGAYSVVSSAYNTPLGLSFLVQLAAALHCPHAGLDTWRWFPGALADGLHSGSAGIDVAASWLNSTAAFDPFIK